MDKKSKGNLILIWSIIVVGFYLALNNFFLGILVKNQTVIGDLNHAGYSDVKIISRRYFFDWKTLCPGIAKVGTNGSDVGFRVSAVDEHNLRRDLVVCKSVFFSGGKIKDSNGNLIETYEK